MSDYIESEKNVSTSSELFRLRTLKDQVQYLCRSTQSQPGPSAKETKSRRKMLTSVPLKRRRVSSTAGSDDDESSPTHATQVKDLPGYCQPTSSKRRKLFDRNLLIHEVSDGETPMPSDVDVNKQLNASSRTVKSNETAAPALSMSVKKRDFDTLTLSRPSTSFNIDANVPFELLSETIMGNEDFQNLIAENINTSGIVERVQSNEGNTGNSDILNQQLEDCMENIVLATAKNPMFDDIVREAIENHWPENEEQMSSSTPTKSSEHETANEELTDTQSTEPAAQTESIKQRLRPRKVIPTIDLTTATTKKRRSDKNIEVISDVRTYPNNPIQFVQTSDGQLQLKTQPLLQMQPQSSQQQSVPIYVQFQDSNGTSYLVPAANVIGNEQPQSNPYMLDIPSISSMITSLDPGTILNITDPQNTIIVQPQNSVEGEEPSSTCVEGNRFIVINSDEVNAEGQKGSTTQSERTVASASSEQPPKSNTPQQPVETNVPSSSKSSATPRHKISHVRVLDFTTPARNKFKTIDPNTATYTGGLDALNASRQIDDTPHNRSIASTVPNSAPPKIDSTKSERVAPPILHTETSSSMDTVIHVDISEDTVISVGSETPKVRKLRRNACVRTLSTHKELNEEVAADRLKRLEKTKKKIQPDEDSNEASGGTQTNAFKAISEEKAKEATATTETASTSAEEEWRRLRDARKNPALFEQMLREESSKEQEKKDTENACKRRNKRNERKKAASTVVAPTNAQSIAETANLSETFNSTMESEFNESNTLLNAHAQMLENNLKSAKKLTPEKKTTKPKPKRNKNEIRIKLPESPTVKALKRHRSSSKLKASAPEVSSTTEQQSDSHRQEQGQEKISTDADVKTSLPPQPADEPIARANTSNDLEVARDLLQLNETIIQKEKQLSARKVTGSQPDCTSTVTTAYQKNAVGTSTTATTAATDNVQRNASLSLSALLETPLKLDDFPLFPKTPNVHFPPQLVTPMLRTTMSNPMDESLMKNPAFPTPNYPITPGAILTPFRDIPSPRSDQELTYGAANRPTDYSSSSSYYKPDESDGVDKQLQALLRAARTNTQSADEMIDEFVSNEPPHDDPSLERLNYSGRSSSSSSSSSSDDSDSDSSDSSSSSSDTNSTRKSVTVDAVEETDRLDAVEQNVAEIKSLIESSTVGAASSTLLKESMAAKDRRAEQEALLAEKRLRMQEFCRQNNSAKPILKPASKAKTSKKVRSLAEARHDTFRGPTKIISPSKRKLSQPRKIVSKPTAIEQKASSEPNTVATGDESKPVERRTIETKSVAPETNEKKPRVLDAMTSGDEESIDAIRNHLAKDAHKVRTSTRMSQLPAQSIASSENLIEILEDKSTAPNKRSPSVKTTKRIEPLPLRRTAARSSKKPNEIKASAAPTAKAKPQSKSKSKTVETAPPVKTIPEPTPTPPEPTTAPPEPAPTPPEPTPTPPEPIKSNDSQNKLSSKDESRSNPRTSSPVPETPAKERQLKQMHSIFGNISDIETPVKNSPLKSTATPDVPASSSVEEAKQDSPPSTDSSNQQQSLSPKEPSPSKENHVTSTTASDQSESRLERSPNSNDSNANDSESDDDDEDDDSDDEFEMYVAQEHYETHVVSNNRSIPKLSAESLPIRSIKLVVNDRTVVWTASSEIVLYQSEEPVPDAEDSPSAKETASSAFDKPLQTSTPSGQQSKATGPNPRFNLKHKDHAPT